jgi:hypothetical protein
MLIRTAHLYQMFDASFTAGQAIDGARGRCEHLCEVIKLPFCKAAWELLFH